MGAGARLQDPGDEAGDGPSGGTGEHTEREVDPGREVDRETDIGGRHRPGDELALAADVEHAGAKAERDAESGDDERGRRQQGLGDRGQRGVPARARCGRVAEDDGSKIEPVNRAP